MARKYSKAAGREVEKEMHRYKKGTAHSGPKNKPVKSRKQAIAIALSKARKKGAKAPEKPSSTRPKIRTSTSRSKTRLSKNSKGKRSRRA